MVIFPAALLVIVLPSRFSSLPCRSVSSPYQAVAKARLLCPLQRCTPRQPLEMPRCLFGRLLDESQGETKKRETIDYHITRCKLIRHVSGAVLPENSIEMLARVTALFVACAVLASASDVVELTASNFKSQVLDSDKVWLVEFYGKCACVGRLCTNHACIFSWSWQSPPSSCEMSC
jgi:hypothetical protein